MRSVSIFLTLFLTFLAMTQAAIADEAMMAASETLVWEDQLGGGSYAVAAQGKYLYAAIGPRLAILEADDQGQFSIVGQTEPFRNMVQAIAVSGSYAYLEEIIPIAWNRTLGAFHIVDISQPASPRVVKTTYDMLVNDMFIQEPYLFTISDDGMGIYDLSQSPTLREVGRANTPGQAILVKDDIAYILQWRGQLLILDVSDPTHPEQISQITWGLDQSWEMVLNFPYLTIANGYAGLTVIDVSDPVHPQQISNVSMKYYARAIALSAPYLYVSEGGKLHVFEQDEHGQLRAIDDSQRLPTTTRQMIVHQNHLISAAGGPEWWDDDGYGGLFIDDISTPASPQRRQWINISAHARAIAWKDPRRAYVVGDDGFYVLDLTPSGKLTQKAFLPTYPTVDVDVQQMGAKTYAFLAQRWQGLEIVDVTQADAPVTLARYNLNPSGNISTVIVEGSTVYLGVSATQEGLVVLDVSTPEQPQKIGSLQDIHNVKHLTKQNQFIYLITDNSLHVIDVSNPNAPQIVGQLTLLDGTSFYEIAVQQDYAYVAASERGVRVIDISQPDHPRLETSIALPAFTNHVQTAGNLLITSHYMEDTRQGRLYLTDISDPKHPTTNRYLDTAGEPFQVVGQTDQVMVPDAQGGVRLYRSVSLTHSLFVPYIYITN